MIYVGFLDLNDTSDRTHELLSAIDSYVHTTIVVRKKFLTLCYGKLSGVQDMDEIWESSSSILMGRIFDKTQSRSFGKKDFENLSHMSKEEVLEKIWGKYVYINIRRESLRFEIVVDSTGRLPFFYYSFPNGNVLFSSDIEIIFKIIGQNQEYNWTYLCSYLAYGNSSTVQTPFKNIYELPPACCLEITKNERKTKPFWNPLLAYKKASVCRPKNAVNVLQTTLKPLIEPYKNICVSLSGGLDSAALTYCLKSIKKEEQVLSALNYFHASIKSSNELLHARRVCQETDIELIEVEVSQFLPFDPPLRKQAINPNKPFPGLVSLKCLEVVSNHIPSTDSCIFLSGHGSDHIFMYPPSKQSVSDYIIEKGLTGSKEQLKNIAHFYRDSLFSIFKENVKSLSSYFLFEHLEKKYLKNTQNKLPSWIKKGLHQKISNDFMHPIHEYLPSRILPGKYQQIKLLYEGIASTHMEMDQVNPTCYPFLYEPIVEFALSFPTYTLFEKGYDRYPLRKDVNDYFKTETVWRRDKNQTTGIFQLGVKKNLEYVLDLCLEGQFVKKDLVSREEINKTIMLIANGDNNHLWSFMHLVSVEMFFKYWESKIL